MATLQEYEYKYNYKYNYKYKKIKAIHFVPWLALAGSHERRLLNDLMNTYNKLERPVNTNTQIQIHDYKYAITNTQLQLRNCKYANKNTQLQIHMRTQIHLQQTGETDKYKYAITNTHANTNTNRNDLMNTCNKLERQKNTNTQL